MGIAYCLIYVRWWPTELGSEKLLRWVSTLSNMRRCGGGDLCNPSGGSRGSSGHRVRTLSTLALSFKFLFYWVFFSFSYTLSPDEILHRSIKKRDKNGAYLTRSRAYVGYSALGTQSTCTGVQAAPEPLLSTVKIVMEESFNPLIHVRVDFFFKLTNFHNTLCKVKGKLQIMLTEGNQLQNSSNKLVKTKKIRKGQPILL